MSKMSGEVTWRGWLMRVLLTIGSVALIVWFMPSDNKANFKVEREKPWRYATLTAPFDFPIYKSERAIKAERDSLMRQYEPYYNFHKDMEDDMVRKFVQDFSKGIPGLSNDYISIIANRLHRFYTQGIMNSLEFSELLKDTAQQIRIVSGKSAVSVPVKELLSAKGAYEQLFADPLLTDQREVLQACNLNNYLVPNLIYDKERSEASLADLMSTIPLASGMVQRGQKIIDRGDIVDENTYNIVQSFLRESDRRQQSDKQVSVSVMGRILYVFLCLLCFTIYLDLFRKDYFDKVRSSMMPYAHIVLFSIVTSLMVGHNILHVYIIPLAMVPIIIRVFMDSRTAFMTHVTMVLVCASVLQHPMEFIAIELVAGMAAIFSLRELSSRSQLFKTAIIVTLAGMAMNLALNWIRNDALTGTDFSEYNYLIVNGILLVCVYPLLYLIEKMFGFTSNITLIELSDMNKELLRRMSEVAPGTFQHSIQVANLAAEIANKIDGKSQLVRTGALYHDVGKIMNPIYFTENQSGVNPHESLTQIESAQMIISHVTEGLKLAEKYNLPKVIKDFISTHHGQGKTKYFYVNYKNEHPDEPVDDLLFTYPGPNPSTKEQAILMMADAVEAASRSLPDYTEQSIRNLVNRLIDSQVAEGYFRECPITFRDIQYAKTVLIEKLKTIYHTRVSYPELKKSE